jgi:hypothetical protein
MYLPSRVEGSDMPTQKNKHEMVVGDQNAEVAMKLSHQVMEQTEKLQKAEEERDANARSRKFHIERADSFRSKYYRACEVLMDIRNIAFSNSSGADEQVMRIIRDKVEALLG